MWFLLWSFYLEVTRYVLYFRNIFLVCANCRLWQVCWKALTALYGPNSDIRRHDRHLALRIFEKRGSTYCWAVMTTSRAGMVQKVPQKTATVTVQKNCFREQQRLSQWLSTSSDYSRCCRNSASTSPVFSPSATRWRLRNRLARDGSENK